MSDMIRTAIGAIVFIVAALFFIYFIANMPGKPSLSAKNQKAEVVNIKPAPKAEAEAETETEAETEAEPVVAAKPVAVAKAKAVARVVDADKGFKIFKRKCLGCHTVNKGAPNRTGPNLWAIVGEDKAAMEGYRYSRTLKTFGGTWTEAELSRFIAGPRVMVRDTKMTFRGMKVEADRLDIIAFLKTLKD